MTLIDFRSFVESTILPQYQPPRWSWVGSAGGGFSTGRFTGTTCRQHGSGGTRLQYDFATPIPSGTGVVIGSAFRVDSGYSVQVVGYPLLAFNSGAARIEVHLQTAALGQRAIRLRTTAGSTNDYTSTITIPEHSVWHYIELKVSAVGAGAVATVRLDAATILTSGSDIAPNDITSAEWGGNGSYVADVYVADTTGSAPANNYLGDVRCDYLTPNGNGTSSQLLGSDGNSVNNYLLVDEVPTNTSDYVGSSTPGQKDFYTVADVAATGDKVFFGAKTTGVVFKNDAGTAKMRVILKDGATEHVSPTSTLSTTASAISTSIITERTAGGPLTSADINAIEVGAEVVA